MPDDLIPLELIESAAWASRIKAPQRIENLIALCQAIANAPAQCPACGKVLNRTYLDPRCNNKKCHERKPAV